MSEAKRLSLLDDLSGGHSILKAEHAKQVCETFDIPYDEKRLLRKHIGHPEHFDTWAGSIEGVWDLDLLAYIARTLQVTDVGQYLGRGFQARAYTIAIKRKLGLAIEE